MCLTTESEPRTPTTLHLVPKLGCDPNTRRVHVILVEGCLVFEGWALRETPVALPPAARMFVRSEVCSDTRCVSALFVGFGASVACASFLVRCVLFADTVGIDDTVATAIRSSVRDGSNAPACTGACVGVRALLQVKPTAAGA